MIFGNKINKNINIEKITGNNDNFKKKGCILKDESEYNKENEFVKKYLYPLFDFYLLRYQLYLTNNSKTLARKTAFNELLKVLKKYKNKILSESFNN